MKSNGVVDGQAICQLNNEVVGGFERRWRRLALCHAISSQGRAMQAKKKLALIGSVRGNIWGTHLRGRTLGGGRSRDLLETAF